MAEPRKIKIPNLFGQQPISDTLVSASSQPKVRTGDYSSTFSQPVKIPKISIPKTSTGGTSAVNKSLDAVGNIISAGQQLKKSSNNKAEQVRQQILKSQGRFVDTLQGEAPVLAGDARYTDSLTVNKFGQVSTDANYNDKALVKGMADKAVEEGLASGRELAKIEKPARAWYEVLGDAFAILPDSQYVAALMMPAFTSARRVSELNTEGMIVDQGRVVGIETSALAKSAVATVEGMISAPFQAASEVGNVFLNKAKQLFTGEGVDEEFKKKYNIVNQAFSLQDGMIEQLKGKGVNENDLRYRLTVAMKNLSDEDLFKVGEHNVSYRGALDFAGNLGIDILVPVNIPIAKPLQSIGFLADGGKAYNVGNTIAKTNEYARVFDTLVQQAGDLPSQMKIATNIAESIGKPEVAQQIISMRSLQPFQDMVANLGKEYSVTPELFRHMVLNDPRRFTPVGMKTQDFISNQELFNKAYDEFSVNATTAGNLLDVRLDGTGTNMLGAMEKKQIEYLAQFDINTVESLTKALPSMGDLEKQTEVMTTMFRKDADLTFFKNMSENPLGVLQNRNLNMFDPKGQFATDFGAETKTSASFIQKLGQPVRAAMDLVNIKDGTSPAMKLFGARRGLSVGDIPAFSKLAMKDLDVSLATRTAQEQMMTFLSSTRKEGVTAIGRLRTSIASIADTDLNKIIEAVGSYSGQVKGNSATLLSSAADLYRYKSSINRSNALAVLIEHQDVLLPILNNPKYTQIVENFNEIIGTIRKFDKKYGIEYALENSSYYRHVFPGKKVSPMGWFKLERTSGKTILQAAANGVIFDGDIANVARHMIDEHVLTGAVLETSSRASNMVLNSGSTYLSTPRILDAIKTSPKLSSAVTSKTADSLGNVMNVVLTKAQKTAFPALLKGNPELAKYFKAKYVAAAAQDVVMKGDQAAINFGKVIDANSGRLIIESIQGAGLDELNGFQRWIMDTFDTNVNLGKIIEQKGGIDKFALTSMKEDIFSTIDNSRFTKIFKAQSVELQDTITTLYHANIKFDVPIIVNGKSYDTFKEVLDTGVVGLEEIVKNPIALSKGMKDLGLMPKYLDDALNKILDDISESATSILGSSYKLPENADIGQRTFSFLNKINRASRYALLLNPSYVAKNVLGNTFYTMAIAGLSGVSPKNLKSQLKLASIFRIKRSADEIKYLKEIYGEAVKGPRGFSQYVQEFMARGFGIDANANMDDIVKTLSPAEREVFDLATNSKDFKNMSFAHGVAMDINEIVTSAAGSNIPGMARKSTPIPAAVRKLGQELKATISSDPLATYYMASLSDLMMKFGVAQHVIKKYPNRALALREFENFFSTFKDLAPYEQFLARNVFMFYTFQRNTFKNMVGGLLSGDKNILNFTVKFMRLQQYMQDPEVQELLNQLPEDDWRRNGFWVGNQDNFITGLANPVDEAYQFSKMLMFLSPSGDIDPQSQVQVAAQRANLPISVILALQANRDPFTQKQITPDGTVPDYKTYSVPSNTAQKLLDPLPPAIQAIFGYEKKQDPLSKKDLKFINPTWGYIIEKQPLLFVNQVVNTIAGNGREDRATGQEGGSGWEDWLAMTTGIRARSVTDMYITQEDIDKRMTRQYQDFLKKNKNLQSTESYWQTSAQKYDLGLPQTIDQRYDALDYKNNDLTWRQQTDKRQLLEKGSTVDIAGVKTYQKMVDKMQKQAESEQKKEQKKIGDVLKNLY